MKIAMMVRGYIPVPRPVDIIYAPIDLAVHIAEGLVKLGHEVDFFAPNGSHIPGVTMHSQGLRALIHDQQEMQDLFFNNDLQAHGVPGLWDAKLANEMFARAEKGQYDALYFHHPETALALAVQHPKVPVIYTLNDPIYDWYKEIFELYHSPNQHFVSISNNQRRDAPDLPYIDTVHNGVDYQKFNFSDSHEEYLLFAGRIVPEKGIKEAIKVAQDTNHRLLIIGPTFADKKEYFNMHIKPHLNEKILYLGFMEQEQLVKYFQKAKAFLMPIQWEEPFGLTMIESMACGTPVIALRRGAVPEVVVDGKTGFIVDSISEMSEAVSKIDQISRQDCRRHVEQHFSIEQMVKGYEAAFASVIKPAKNLQHRRQTTVAKKIKDIPARVSSRLRQLK